VVAVWGALTHTQGEAKRAKANFTLPRKANFALRGKANFTFWSHLLRWIFIRIYCTVSQWLVFSSEYHSRVKKQDRVSCRLDLPRLYICMVPRWTYCRASSNISAATNILLYWGNPSNWIHSYIPCSSKTLISWQVNTKICKRQWNACAERQATSVLCWRLQSSENNLSQFNLCGFFYNKSQHPMLLMLLLVAMECNKSSSWTRDGLFWHKGLFKTELRDYFQDNLQHFILKCTHGSVCQWVANNTKSCIQ